MPMGIPHFYFILFIQFCFPTKNEKVSEKGMELENMLREVTGSEKPILCELSHT